MNPGSTYAVRSGNCPLDALELAAGRLDPVQETPSLVDVVDFSYKRDIYVIDGKEYDECGLCRASCPSRDLFKEPDSGLPLKCDLCEGEEKPLCVTWCLSDVLIYEGREEEEEEEEEEDTQPGDLDIGLESLANKYGLDKVLDTVARMSKGS